MRSNALWCALLLAGAANAAEPEQRWKVVAETDLISIPISLTNVPSYSLHVGLKAPALPRFLFGVGVFGSRELPDFFTALLNSANGVDNDGWTVGFDGVGLRTVWYFGDGGSGFFAGAYWAWMRWEQRHAASGTQVRTNQLLAWPTAGFRWFPVEAPVFLSAFLSAGVTTPSFMTERTGDAQYQELRWYPFAALHLGFEL